MTRGVQVPANHRSSRSLRRTALSVALIVVFCFVPVRMLYQNINSSAGRQELQDPVTLSAPSNGTYGSPVQLYQAGGSEVCVLFEFLGFDPATSLANFGVVVDANRAGAAQISKTLNTMATRKYIPLLRISSNTGLSSITIPIPVSVLLAADANTPCSQRGGQPYLGDGGSRVLQDIFLLGQPRAFPNDWYELDDTVAVYMCPPEDTQGTCAPGTNENATAQKPMRLQEALIATTRDQDLTMTVATGVPGVFIRTGVERDLLSGPCRRCTHACRPCV
jgi:hypothetical protein